MKKLTVILYLIIIAVFFSHGIHAHTRFSEEVDFSSEKPFTVNDSIENAKAVYARLAPGTDVDVYTFTVTEPVRIYVKAFVPMTKGLERFLPCVAVAGPGLPKNDKKLPFSIPDGLGVVVIRNFTADKQRPIFYEPFSGTKYYDAPAFDHQSVKKGTWYLYFWDPEKNGGAYVAILGFREKFY